MVHQEIQPQPKPHLLARLIPNAFWTIGTWLLFIFGKICETISSNFRFDLFLTFVIAAALTVLYSSREKTIALLTLAANPYAAFLVFATYTRAVADYHAFLALGKGGTPSTWYGFKRITLNAWCGRINVFSPPANPLGPGHLNLLPKRQGGTPQIGGIAPQRQLDQRSTDTPEGREVFRKLTERMSSYGDSHEHHLCTGISFLERGTEAIFAQELATQSEEFKVFGREIAHPHHVDGSLHVVLHPNDIALVMAQGWGERHPLARSNWLWRAWFKFFEGRPPVPEYLAFVHAPRTDDELDTVMSIVQAGAKFVADAPKEML